MVWTRKARDAPRGNAAPRGMAPRWLLVASAAAAALFFVPFGYLIARNLGGEPLSEAFTGDRLIGPFVNSLLLAGAVSVSATVLGAGAAWLVARTDVPGARWWRLLLPLPLVIPSFIGAFVLLAAFAPGGVLESMLGPVGVGRLPSVRGFLGSFLVLTLLTYPYVYMPAVARFRQLSSSLEESARLLGARGTRVFLRVILPQARGAILAGALLVFLYVISDFGVVQLMGYDSLTRIIYATRVFARPTSLALSLQLGLLASLVVIVERAATKGPGRIGSRTTTVPLRTPLGRWRVLAGGAVATVVALSLLVPVGVLLWWSGRALLPGGSGVGGRTLSDPLSLLQPLVNTVSVSVLAAVVATISLAPVAYLTVKYRSVLGNFANAVIVAGFALPGLAIALALVSLTVGAPGPLGNIYQSLPLLVIAYVIHFGAQSLRSSQVAVASVPERFDDAARVLGVSRTARFFQVELPLMAPGLLAGAGLVLLSTMKELPATLLLAPAGFQTLAMDVWQATESAYFADASMASLVLIALSGVLTWWLVIRRSEPSV